MGGTGWRRRTRIGVRLRRTLGFVVQPRLYQQPAGGWVPRSQTRCPIRPRLRRTPMRVLLCTLADRKGVHYRGGGGRHMLERRAWATVAISILGSAAVTAWLCARAGLLSAKRRIEAAEVRTEKIVLHHYALPDESL